MNPVIDVQNVSKKYRLYDSQRDTLRERFVGLGRSGFADFWALQDINFHVEAGDTFGIIGHNGSGKSTLLRLMAGVHRPTSCGLPPSSHRAASHNSATSGSACETSTTVVPAWRSR